MEKRTFHVDWALWAPILTTALAMAIPALVWAGDIKARLETLEREAAARRIELREDLREINRKLDALMERGVVRPER